MATIAFKQVSKVYEGGVRAVDAIDLSIGEGEFCVLVGPSGCGKSTTLRMLAGLEEITSGTLELDARRVNDCTAKERDIAFVFQNYALYPHLTVQQNIAFGLDARRTHKSALAALLRGNSDAMRAESRAIDARVATVAQTLGLEPLLARYPRELSGGQRQRVAVGRAIARSPKVFLFDEPLSNLDARLRIETRSELRQLHRRLRATIVYVTHDQEEAMTLADRLVVMHQGRIQQNATPAACYDTPANRFVAGFIGTPQMNLIDGDLSVQHGELGFESHGFRMPLAAHWPSLSNASPQSIALGIRPDRLLLSGASAHALPATVQSIESLGDRTDLALQSAWGRLVLRATPESVAGVREGDAVHVTLAPSHAHLFEVGEVGARVPTARS
ncbi:MAG: ATP-binding cassette domain-containing protein [Phycisphaerales bacterium]|nr:ATP-binding cassette domain-containing protein [Phycisphaerales bacterium]